MRVANRQALALLYSTIASEYHESDTFIRSVISQNLIQNFLKKFQLQEMNPQLFVESLIHSSFVNEFRHLSVGSNERLELLGDAVLDLYVTDKLYQKFPNKPEGELSRIRGALVNEQKLYEVAKLIELSELILTGKGEAKARGNEKPAIMADAFEAVIGAIYKCLGPQGVNRFLDNVFEAWSDKEGKTFFDENLLHVFDAKSRLQELTMAHFKELPEYASEEVEEGFRVSCLLKGKVLATITGPSKKKAQRELAEKIIIENLLDIDQTQSRGEEQC